MKQTKSIIYLTFLAIAVTAIYYRTVVVLWGRWFETGSYYQHALGIPLLSAWLIWRGRNALQATYREPNRWGIALVGAAGILHLISILLEFEVVSALSIPILIGGLFIHFFGFRVTRRFLFPIAILFLCIPPPLAIMDSLTLGLKLFAARVSDGIVSLIGIATVREGSVIHITKGTIVVGSPCSGMQSIITLITVSIVYAYFKKEASWKQKTIIVLMAIPLALVFNVLRLVLTIAIAQLFGMNWVVNGMLHEGFGLIVIVIAFFTLTKIFQWMVSRNRPFDKKQRLSENPSAAVSDIS